MNVFNSLVMKLFGAGVTPQGISGLGDPYNVTILNVLGDFFVGLWAWIAEGFMLVVYYIMRFILNLVDFLQFFCKKLAGLDYWLEGDMSLETWQESDIIFRFILNDDVQRVFKYMLGVSVVLLIIFAIVAIVKNEYQYATDTGGKLTNDKMGILKRCLKAISLVVLIPIMIIFGILSSNAILASLVNAFNINNNLTMGGQVFTAAAYNANKYRSYAQNNRRLPITTTVWITDANSSGTVETIKMNTDVELVTPKDYSDSDFYGFLISYKGEEYLYKVSASDPAGHMKKYNNHYAQLFARMGVSVVDPGPIEDASSVSGSTTGGFSVRLHNLNQKHRLVQAAYRTNKFNKAYLIKGLEFDKTLEVEEDAFQGDSGLTVNANWYFNNEVWGGVFDGGGKKTDSFIETKVAGCTNCAAGLCVHHMTKIGFVALQEEYMVMADVIDFILSDQVPNMHIININNILIDWTYGNETGYLNAKYVKGISSSARVEQFVVNYESKGYVAYNPNLNASKEEDGAIFIMAYYNAKNNKYVPVVNGKTYVDENGFSHQFKSENLDDKYNGLVIARGILQSSYNNAKGAPTQIVATTEGLGTTNYTVDTPYYAEMEAESLYYKLDREYTFDYAFNDKYFTNGYLSFEGDRIKVNSSLAIKDGETDLEIYKKLQASLPTKIDFKAIGVDTEISKTADEITWEKPSGSSNQITLDGKAYYVFESNVKIDGVLAENSDFANASGETTATIYAFVRVNGTTVDVMYAYSMYADSSNVEGYLTDQFAGHAESSVENTYTVNGGVIYGFYYNLGGKTNSSTESGAKAKPLARLITINTDINLTNIDLGGGTAVPEDYVPTNHVVAIVNKSAIKYPTTAKTLILKDTGSVITESFTGSAINYSKDPDVTTHKSGSNVTYHTLTYKISELRPEITGDMFDNSLTYSHVHTDYVNSYYGPNPTTGVNGNCSCSYGSTHQFSISNAGQFNLVMTEEEDNIKTYSFVYQEKVSGSYTNFVIKREENTVNLTATFTLSYNLSNHTFIINKNDYYELVSSKDGETGWKREYVYRGDQEYPVVVGLEDLEFVKNSGGKKVYRFLTEVTDRKISSIDYKGSEFYAYVYLEDEQSSPILEDGSDVVIDGEVVTWNNSSDNPKTTHVLADGGKYQMYVITATYYNVFTYRDKDGKLVQYDIDAGKPGDSVVFPDGQRLVVRPELVSFEKQHATDVNTKEKTYFATIYWDNNDESPTGKGEAFASFNVRVSPTDPLPDRNPADDKLAAIGEAYLYKLPGGQQMPNVPKIEGDGAPVSEVFASSLSMKIKFSRYNFGKWTGYFDFRGITSLKDFSLIRFKMDLIGTTSHEEEFSGFQIERGALAFDYNFVTPVNSGIGIMTFFIPSQLNFVVLVFAGFLLLSVLGKAVWGLIGRIFDITLYFLIMPGVVATLPLESKGDGIFKNWREALVSKVLGAYGVLIGLNFFFIILPAIRDASRIFTQADMDSLSAGSWIRLMPVNAVNELVYVLFLLVAFTLINTVPGLISKMIGAENSDVVSTGQGIKSAVQNNVHEVGRHITGQSLKEFPGKVASEAKNFIPGFAFIEPMLNKGKGKGKNKDEEARERGAEAARQEAEARMNQGNEAYNSSDETPEDTTTSTGSTETTGSTTDASASAESSDVTLDSGDEGEGEGVIGAIGAVASGVANAMSRAAESADERLEVANNEVKKNLVEGLNEAETITQLEQKIKDKDNVEKERLIAEEGLKQWQKNAEAILSDDSVAQNVKDKIVKDENGRYYSKDESFARAKGLPTKADLDENNNTIQDATNKLKEIEKDEKQLEDLNKAIDERDKVKATVEAEKAESAEVAEKLANPENNQATQEAKGYAEAAKAYADASKIYADVAGNRVAPIYEQKKTRDEKKLEKLQEKQQERFEKQSKGKATADKLRTEKSREEAIKQYNRTHKDAQIMFQTGDEESKKAYQKAALESYNAKLLARNPKAEAITEEAFNGNRRIQNKVLNAFDKEQKVRMGIAATQFEDNKLQTRIENLQTKIQQKKDGTYQGWFTKAIKNNVFFRANSDEARFELEEKKEKEIERRSKFMDDLDAAKKSGKSDKEIRNIEKQISSSDNVINKLERKISSNYAGIIPGIAEGLTRNGSRFKSWTKNAGEERYLEAQAKAEEAKKEIDDLNSKYNQDVAKAETDWRSSTESATKEANEARSKISSEKQADYRTIYEEYENATSEINKDRVKFESSLVTKQVLGEHKTFTEEQHDQIAKAVKRAQDAKDAADKFESDNNIKAAKHKANADPKILAKHEELRIKAQQERENVDALVSKFDAENKETRFSFVHRQGLADAKKIKEEQDVNEKYREQEQAIDKKLKTAITDAETNYNKDVQNAADKWNDARDKAVDKSLRADRHAEKLHKKTRESKDEAAVAKAEENLGKLSTEKFTYSVSHGGEFTDKQLKKLHSSKRTLNAAKIALDRTLKDSTSTDFDKSKRAKEVRDAQVAYENLRIAYNKANGNSFVRRESKLAKAQITAVKHGREKDIEALNRLKLEGKLGGLEEKQILESIAVRDSIIAQLESHPSMAGRYKKVKVNSERYIDKKFKEKKEKAPKEPKPAKAPREALTVKGEYRRRMKDSSYSAERNRVLEESAERRAKINTIKEKINLNKNEDGARAQATALQAQLDHKIKESLIKSGYAHKLKAGMTSTELAQLRQEVVKELKAQRQDIANRVANDKGNAQAVANALAKKSEIDAKLKNLALPKSAVKSAKTIQSAQQRIDTIGLQKDALGMRDSRIEAQIRRSFRDEYNKIIREDLSKGLKPAKTASRAYADSIAYKQLLSKMSKDLSSKIAKSPNDKALADQLDKVQRQLKAMKELDAKISRDAKKIKKQVADIMRDKRSQRYKVPKIADTTNPNPNGK